MQERVLDLFKFLLRFKLDLNNVCIKIQKPFPVSVYFDSSMFPLYVKIMKIHTTVIKYQKILLFQLICIENSSFIFKYLVYHGLHIIQQHTYNNC